MGTLLVIGWLILAGYLLVLLALSAAIALADAVRNHFRRWIIHDTSRFRSQA